MFSVPKAFFYIGLCLVTLALLPPAIIARARAAKSARPRIHIFQDMDNQTRFKSQQVNPIFRDERAMRPPVQDAVARTVVVGDDHFNVGVVGGTWATTLPPAVPTSMETLELGRERYEIFCSVCHGLAGYGDGIVHVRAMQLMNNPAIGNGTTWVQPKNIHEPEIREQPIGQIFNSITNGIRNMSGYGSQMPTEHRWAVAAYVKALQRSQNAKRSDLPPGLQPPTVDLMPEEEE